MSTEAIKIIQYPDGRVDTENAARYLGLAAKTLAMMRVRGHGPRYVKRRQRHAPGREPAETAPMNGIRACFQGRLGGDAELKTVKQDLALSSFSVAVEDGREGRETQWIKVCILGDKAKEHAELRKGDELYCEGSLQPERYTRFSAMRSNRC